MTERLRVALGFALLGGLFLTLGVVYPALVDAALERFGVHAVAAATAVAALLGLEVRRRFGASLPDFPRSEPLGRGQLVGVLAVVGTAAATGDRRWLLLLPGLAYLYLAWTFWMSLGEEVSIVQRAALAIQPHSPDFIAGYCRKATALWTGIFLVNGVVVAAVALWASLDTWRLVAGCAVFVVMAAVGMAEFVFRKWWFRHYEDHALDRLLARLMPPEATERGRRSLAFIRDMKARLRAEREAGGEGEGPGAATGRRADARRRG